MLDVCYVYLENWLEEARALATLNSLEGCFNVAFLEVITSKLVDVMLRLVPLVAVRKRLGRLV